LISHTVVFHTRPYANATVLGKIVQGVEANKMRLECPDDVALEQKEKELTGLVHSFCDYPKISQQALLDVPAEERERAPSSLLT
jgi:hypothetical protein